MTNRYNISGRMRSVALAITVLVLIASKAKGQPMANAKLTVTARVQGSIGLVFDNNPSVGTTGFCPLTNAGTNNVGLNLGTAAFPGSFHSLACVNYQHIGAAFYEVSSGFDVVVSEANSNSPNYRLAAEISTAPPASVVWLINNVTLSNTAFTTLDTTDSYASRITKTLQVQVKNNVAAQVLQETITFLATAN